MLILVRDIDFAKRRLALEIDGSPTQENYANLKSYLANCLEYGFAEVLIAHKGGSTVLLDPICDELRNQYDLKITTCSDLSIDPAHPDRKTHYTCKRVKGQLKKQSHIEYQLHLKDIRNALNEVSQFVLLLGHSVQLDPLALSRTRLCLTELAVNSLDHADFQGVDPEINVSLVILADYVEARYNDNAARFDITEETEVDIANQIKKNVKRGLGLHMLQKMTDELTYKRKGKRNYTMLRLRRNRSTIPVEG